MVGFHFPPQLQVNKKTRIKMPKKQYHLILL